MSKHFVPQNFKKGDPLRAEDLNAIAAAAARHGTMQPDDGEFVNNQLGCFRSQSDPTPGSSLVPFMLLTNMTTRTLPYLSTDVPVIRPRSYVNTTQPSNNNPARWRHFNAMAVRLAYTPLHTYVLRMNTDASTSLQFYFSFGGGYQTAVMRNEASPSINQAPSASQMQAIIESLPFATGKVSVTGYKSYYGGDNVRLATTKQWIIQFASTFPAPSDYEIYQSSTDENGIPTYTVRTTVTPSPHSGNFFVNQTPSAIQWWQDDYYPTDDVKTVWAGLPSQSQLRAGAFVWAQKVAGRGYVVLHGECYTQVTGTDTTT